MLQVRGWVLFMWGVISLRSPGGLAEKQVNGWSFCPCWDMHSFFFLSTSKQSKLIPTVWHTLFLEGTLFPEGEASLRRREGVKEKRGNWDEDDEGDERKRKVVEDGGWNYEWWHIDSYKMLGAFIGWSRLAVKVPCALCCAAGVRQGPIWRLTSATSFVSAPLTTRQRSLITSELESVQSRGRRAVWTAGVHI